MKCCNCGASLGTFKKYVPLSDGAICLKCFKSLGFDVDKKDEYVNAKCHEIKSGYGHYINKQNQQILEKYDLPNPLPDGYFWADFQTLNILIQFNNCLNIQLRNLLSILNI